MTIVLRATLKTPELCLKLSEAYRKQYCITKDKLLTLHQDRQFDLSETLIFGRFSCCFVKLIDMFGTLHQFQMLLIHMKYMDGIHRLVGFFNALVQEFQGRGHNFVDFRHSRSDRDHVELTVHVSDLDGTLQDFVDRCFASIKSTGTSLKSLGKLGCIL